MKISDLIERLESFKEQNGDLFVVVYQKYHTTPTTMVSLSKIDYDTSFERFDGEIVIPVCFVMGRYE